MTQPTQAHNAYMPGYKQISHHEWRTVENSAAYLISTLREKSTQDPNLSILDVGCGPGTISASLATHIPHGHVTGIDLTAEVLAKARTHAASLNIPNVSFQIGSIYELPFEDNTFDIVHASMVLVHLDSPVQALREMLRVTKPGGVVADREADLRMVATYPETDALKRALELQLATHAAAGGANDAGRRLVSWAMKAGVDRGKIWAGMSTWFYSTPEEREMWGDMWASRIRSGGMRGKARELGIAGEGEMEEMARAWEEWVKTEDACTGSMHGEILITK